MGGSRLPTHPVKSYSAATWHLKRPPPSTPRGDAAASPAAELICYYLIHRSESSPHPHPKINDDRAVAAGGGCLSFRAPLLLLPRAGKRLRRGGVLPFPNFSPPLLCPSPGEGCRTLARLGVSCPEVEGGYGEPRSPLCSRCPQRDFCLELGEGAGSGGGKEGSGAKYLGRMTENHQALPLP